MDAVKKLPFVTSEGDTLNLWAVKNTGSWGHDNKVGRAHGEACLKYMTAENNPAMLFAIVDTIVRRAEPMDGIECGFMQTIAEAAILGSSRLR